MAETITNPPAATSHVAPAQEPATPTSRRDETALEALASYCSVIVVGLFALTFIFQNFVIPSGSMLNTLLVGDHVLVDRTTLAPRTAWAPFVHYRSVHRGDIVVFFKPGFPDNYLVKRVIAVPGDRIHLHEGYVYLNGQRQDEPQAGHPDYGNYDPYRDEFPNVPVTSGQNLENGWGTEFPTHVHDGDLVVPPGNYFAMGDNRLNSWDGRYWGFIPQENVVGRPLFVYWSFITPEENEEHTSMGDRTQQISHTLLHFFDQTRWSRTFHPVR